MTSLIVNFLDFLSLEVEVLLLGHLLLLSWLHLFTELWDTIILVIIVICELDVVVYFWVGGESFIDAGVNIEVSVLWNHASGNNVVISNINWVAFGELSFLFSWSHISLSLGLSSIECSLLLRHHSLVVLGVNSIKLDSHTVVELTLVDGVDMRDWNLLLAGLAAEDFLGLLPIRSDSVAVF